MRNLLVNSLGFVVALTTITSAQTHSAAANVQLRALVAPTAKIAVSGKPELSAGTGGVMARPTSEGKLEILASIASHTSSTRIRVPVRVKTNTRSYLLRVSSIAAGTSGTIRATTQSSTTTREFPLTADRTFAMGSQATSSSSEENYVEVAIPPSGDEQQIRVEVQAVPMN